MFFGIMPAYRLNHFAVANRTSSASTPLCGNRFCLRQSGGICGLPRRLSPTLSDEGSHFFWYSLFSLQKPSSAETLQCPSSSLQSLVHHSSRIRVPTGSFHSTLPRLGVSVLGNRGISSVTLSQLSSSSPSASAPPLRRRCRYVTSSAVCAEEEEEPSSSSSSDPVFAVDVQFTPNPNARIFQLVNHRFVFVSSSPIDSPSGLVHKSASYSFNVVEPRRANKCGLARQLLSVSGVSSVLLTPSHVTVIRKKGADWQNFQEDVQTVLVEYLRKNAVGATQLDRDGSGEEASVHSPVDSLALDKARVDATSASEAEKRTAHEITTRVVPVFVNINETKGQREPEQAIGQSVEIKEVEEEELHSRLSTSAWNQGGRQADAKCSATLSLSLTSRQKGKDSSNSKTNAGQDETEDQCDRHGEGKGFETQRGSADQQGEANDSKEAVIVEGIETLIESHARPMVKQDGGDIEFIKYDKGTVWVYMKGACEGCPSSSVTLKYGLENMLRYFIKEVEQVKQCDENGDPLEDEEQEQTDEEEEEETPQQVEKEERKGADSDGKTASQKANE